MKAYWDKFNARVLVLSRRERVMVLAGVLALMWVMADTLVLAPQLQKNKIYRQEIEAKKAVVAQLQQQEAEAVRAAAVDPDAASKNRLAALQQQVANLDTQLRNMERDLISPERMPQMLDSLLQNDTRLKLVSLKTLPASRLMDEAESARNTRAPVFGIYKHGFQVTLEGSYPDLANYVAALETSKWHVLWENLDLKAAYPTSTLTLTLYTLSLDKAWLSL